MHVDRLLHIAIRLLLTTLGDAITLLFSSGLTSSTLFAFDTLLYQVSESHIFSVELPLLLQDRRTPEC